MTEPTPILIQIAQSLHRRIEETFDHKELLHLGEISMLLDPVYNDAGLDGAGLELFLWAGLKLDGADFWPEYGKGIKKQYPELFSK